MTKPDPYEFPVPHTWATYCPWRNPSFKTHTDLGKAKNAISGKFANRGMGIERAPVDMYVYEWVTDEDGSRWEERFEILEGATKADHELWQFRVPRGGKKVAEVSEKAMEKAIASIMKAAP